jgi:5,5'-dehydrodivanillate O-demethylase
MLSQERNQLLTQVGPGTPMGQLLRRYWMPVAIASELTPTQPTKRVRVLGEDLVLFRDRAGRLGLIGERCPHRGVSLEYGIPDPEGLRCPYHGWLFDRAGRCLDQPCEPPDSTFKHRIRTAAYPVQELGGLIFAYLGPEPAPELPRWDLLVQEGVIRTIGWCVVPANWLQIMENSLDPIHFEWLHGRYFEWVFEQQGVRPERWTLSKHHEKIGFDVFEYGIVKRRVLVGQTEEDDDWRIGHPVVFPNMLRVGDAALHTFQIRVPMDDTHTYHLWYSCFVPDPGVEIPADYPIVAYENPIWEADGKRFVVDYIDGQDMMCWVTQGPVADRTTEHLGTTDKGIILYRQLLLQEMAKVERGEDPMCVFRTPHERIDLPQERSRYRDGGQLSKVARVWSTKYAPNLEEILQLVRGRADSAMLL